MLHGGAQDLCSCDAVAGKVSTLLAVLPTEAEIKLVWPHREAPWLGAAEQFFVEMGRVPRVRAKVEACALMHGFDEMCSRLLTQVIADD